MIYLKKSTTKKICIISDNSIAIRPHLMRMISFLHKEDWVFEIICIGGDNNIVEPHNLYNNLENVNIKVVEKSKLDFLKLNVLLDLYNLYKIVVENTYTIGTMFIVTHPYTLLIAKLANLHSIGKLVYYSAELWDTNRYLLQRSFEYLSSSIIDGWIVSNKERANITKNMFSISSPIIVVPNTCYDYLPFILAERDQTLITSNSVTRFIYQGTSDIIRRKLKELIAVFSELDNSVELYLAIGGGNSDNVKKELKRYLLKTNNPGNVYFLEFTQYPYHFLHTYAADVGVMFYDINISLNYKYCAPNKLFEYAMIGLPILSSHQRHLKSDIVKNNFGMCVNPDNSDEIKNAILSLRDIEKRRDMAKNARKWYLNGQGFEFVGKKLDKWLEKISR